jgi:hypothetical protein
MVRRIWIGGVGWATAILCAGATGCGQALLNVDDAVLLSGEKVRLVAHVERREGPGIRKQIEGASVRFFVNEREVGSDSTDEDGRASVKCSLQPETASRFEAQTVADGNPLRTTGRIFTWRKDRTIVAVDVDGTISQTDYDDLILKKEDETSSPIKRSRQTLEELAKEYQIVYVTARLRVLVEKTRTWLREKEFPPGPVVTAPRLRDVLLQTRFKRKVLANLRDDWPNLLIGIGDREADAEAYGANRMLTLIVEESARTSHRRHAVVLSDWQEVERFFAANREILSTPAKLKNAIEGKTLLLQPVYLWKEDDK